MEKLKGIDSLGVVYKRFSDGCEVIQCILEFYKEMAEVEKSYGSRMSKLLQSSNYTFHSNILYQWLGSEPFEEIGTLKHSWQKLGAELLKLAKLHSDKAETFSDKVRQPLIEILPELEEERKTLRQRKMDLENEIRSSERRFQKVRRNYFRLGDSLAQLKIDLEKLNEHSNTEVGIMKIPRSVLQLDKKISETEKEFKQMEEQYTKTHRELLETQQSLNESISALFSDIHHQELKRVQTVAKSLQEFARTLSNTAPAYLESMQHIVFSVDEISGLEDIENFVSSYPNLHQPPPIPQLELHQCSSRSPEELRRLLDNKNEDTPVIPTTGQREGGVTSANQNSNNTDKIQHDSNEESRSLEKPVAKPVEKPIAKPVSIPEKPVIKSRVPLQSNGRDVSIVKRPHPTQSFSTGKVDSPKTTPSNDKPVVPSKPLIIRTNRSVIKTKTIAPPNRDNECSGIEKGGVHTTLNKEQLLSKLNHQSQLNDYYALLGVIPTATQEELARARREVTSKLHPDHFTGDPEQQAKVQERLVVINQAFTDVLRQENTRQLYDQLCRFREKYHRIIQQERKGLETAKTKLSSLYTNMRKLRFPLSLLNELQLALQLIDAILLSE